VRVLAGLARVRQKLGARKCIPPREGPLVREWSRSAGCSLRTISGKTHSTPGARGFQISVAGKVSDFGFVLSDFGTPPGFFNNLISGFVFTKNVLSEAPIWNLEAGFPRRRVPKLQVTYPTRLQNGEKIPKTDHRDTEKEEWRQKAGDERVMRK